ncbi:MAG: DUF748 domain-containing protein, partial [Deltaproteobacteria bacterium]|nr:DUF748 domain-containing protein [Deltaproteobacteria bacterium]
MLSLKETITTRLTARSRKILIGAAIFFALYTLVGFIVLPLVMKSVLSKKLTEILNRETTIEAIKINPYNLKFTVEGFKVGNGSSEDAFISFDTLFVNLQSVSLFRGGFIVKEFRIEKPYLGIVRTENKSYNFSDLIPESAEGEEAESAEDEEGVKFSINNIQIIDGSADLVDKHKGALHTVREINSTVPFISNLPYNVEVFVEPSFSVIFNDTAFEFGGTTKPFHDSLETTLDIKFDDLAIPYYMAYLPVKAGFNLPSGLFSADLVLSYVQYGDRGPSLTLKGAVSLKEIEVRDLQEKPLVKLPLFTVDIDSAELFEQKIHLSKVALESPELFVELDKDGSVNLLQLLPDTASEGGEAAVSDEGPALSLGIDTIEIAGGGIHFIDHKPSTPFVRLFSPVDVTVSGFSNEIDESGQLRFFFRNSDGESVSTDGTFTITPVTA